jgi:hypothetical protein
LFFLNNRKEFIQKYFKYGTISSSNIVVARKDPVKAERPKSLFITNVERNKVAYDDYQCCFAIYARFYILLKTKNIYIFYFRQQIHFLNKFKIKQENFNQL